MPITQIDTIYDTDGATNSYLHDVTITPALDGAKDASRLRRATAYNFPLNAGPCEAINLRPNNSGQIFISNVPFVRVSLNNADRQFEEAMGSANGFAPPGVIGPKVIFAGSGVLLSVFGVNPRVRNNGKYLIFTDLYRIFAPQLYNIGDCAIDVDLPAPGSSTCRLIYRNGVPSLTARTPPSGWIRYMQRASPFEHYHADGYDAAAQVYPLGDSMLSQWWAHGPSAATLGSRNAIIDPASIPEFRVSGGQYSIQACQVDDTDPLHPIITPLRDIKLRGQWFSFDHNADQPNTGTYNGAVGSALGGDFAVPYTDTTGGSGTTANIVPDLTSALSSPGLSVADSPIFVLTLTSTIHQIVAGNIDHVQEIMRTGLSTSVRYSGASSGNLWCPNFVSPPYYPWDVKFNRFGPDETGITWTTHNGYIPASVPTVPMSDYAPTLVREGLVIYFAGGHDLYDETAPAAQAAYDAANATATATLTAAYAAADAVYATSVAAAATTRTAAYAAAQATLDASPHDPSDYDAYDAAIYAADTAYGNSEATASATRATAYTAADSAYTATMAPYQAALDEATEADWYASQVKPGTATGGGFASPTTLSRANLNQQESSGLMRIWCPELGLEWTVAYGCGRGDVVKVDPGSTSISDHHDYSYTGEKRCVTTTSSIGIRHYPGPAVTLPSSTSGKALFAEVTVAQAMGQAGGFRRTIRRWNPTVP